MSRGMRTGAVIAVLALVVFGAVLAPRVLPSASTRIDVAGDVQAPVVTIVAPSLAYPVPDYTVGIPGASGSSGRPAAASAPRAGAAASRQPVLSGLLTTVTVTEGSRVTTGQIVAQLDTHLLELGVTSARAALAQTRAQADVLADTLDTIAEGRATLATTRAQLEKALAAAVSGRAGLVGQLAQIEAMIPPGAPVPTPTVPPAPPTPQQLVAKLRAALAKLDAGIAQMRAGLAKVSSGSATLSSARRQVLDGRDMLEVLAEGRLVAVRAAEARRDAASIRTEVSGVVAFARAAGTVAMVGSPVVRVVPDGPCRIDTYLTAAQLARVRLGSAASVDFDSNAGAPLRGRITRIGETAQYPPTSFPTDIIHMTSAVLVTITLDGPDTAPAGTPVDVTLVAD